MVRLGAFWQVTARAYAAGLLWTLLARGTPLTHNTPLGALTDLLPWTALPLPLLLARRSGSLRGLDGLLLGACGGLLAAVYRGRIGRTGGCPAVGAPIRILTANLLRGSASAGPTAAAVNAVRADLVLVQEVDAATFGHLGGLLSPDFARNLADSRESARVSPTPGSRHRARSPSPGSSGLHSTTA